MSLALENQREKYFIPLPINMRFSILKSSISIYNLLMLESKLEGFLLQVEIF